MQHVISADMNATGLTQARLVNARFDELRTVGSHLTVNTPNKTRYEGKTSSTLTLQRVVRVFTTIV